MRDTEPWKKWPVRMLRWKAYIQCARVTFGLSGIYDSDEAARIDPSLGAVIDAQEYISTTGGQVAITGTVSPYDAEIASLLAQIKPTMAVERELRDRFKDDAKALRDTLWKIAGSASKKVVGIPSKQEPAAATPAEPAPQQDYGLPGGIVSDDKPPNLTIPDDSARNYAPLGGNAGATGTVSGKENLTIPDDSPRQSVEAQPRKRGPKPRGQQPQELGSEAEERKRAERIIGDSGFDF
jgi:hypothetical protein